MKFLSGYTMHGNQNHAVSDKYPVGCWSPAECGVQASSTGGEFKLDSVYSCKRCVKIVNARNDSLIEAYLLGASNSDKDNTR